MKRDLLKCGECGSDECRLFHERPDDEDRVGKAETRIRAVPAKLTTDDGPLCGGWGKG